MKYIIIVLLSILTSFGSVIDGAEFIDYGHDSKNGVLVFKVLATPLSWVSFYTCANPNDIGIIEKSTFLGGQYFLEYTEEVSFLPNEIGFLWMSSSRFPIYK